MGKRPLPASPSEALLELTAAVTEARIRIDLLLGAHAPELASAMKWTLIGLDSAMDRASKVSR